MALSDERIDAEAFARWGDMKGAPLAMCRGFARSIEAEVRKQDEALIRQMRNALFALPLPYSSETRAALQAGNDWLDAQIKARARLQEKAS